MKKLLMMLLCAATVALVGCNNKDNDLQPDPQPDPQPEYDLNGETDCNIRFYTTDTLLLYANYSVKDTLNPSLDCSQTTVQNFDTLNKADAAVWSLFFRKSKVSISQLRVIVVPAHIKVGDHVFQITYTRNETPATAQKISNVVHCVYFESTNSKAVCSKLYTDAVIISGFKNPETNLPDFLEVISDEPLEFNLKMYK